MPDSPSEPIVAILGPGLLGGSIALALRERQPGTRVHLWARRESALEVIRQAGAAHLASTDVADVVKGASLVVLATPVEIMGDLAARIAPHLSAGALVTDVGSVKQTVVASVNTALSGAGTFLGSHPMAGSEKAGFEAARGDLFEQATCIVTPSEGSCHTTVQRLSAWWSALGCNILTMSPEEHDRKVARISHLPHAVAAAVVRAALAAQPDAALCSGNGFRDATRIAAGDPALWTGIFLENRQEVLSALEDARREMALLVEILKRMDEGALTRFLAEARTLRMQVPPASPQPYGSNQSS